MERLYLEINGKTRINEDTWMITFEGHLEFQPGQFLMVETPKLIRKPFALGKWDGKIAISVQLKGEGTRWIIEKAELLKAHGPLGRAFEKVNGKGLFISSPTCLATARFFEEKFDLDVFVGSRTPLFMDIPYKVAVGNEEFLNLLKSQDGYDWYLIFGSIEMEKVVYRTLKNKKLYFSLEEFMGCGIGACKSCAIETKNGVKHVCTDGPIFEGDELCW